MAIIRALKAGEEIAKVPPLAVIIPVQ